MMLIILCFVRLGDLSCTNQNHYQLRGVSRQAHQVAITAAAVLAAIPVLQFNARLAQATYVLASHEIAPYEITGTFRRQQLPHPCTCKLGSLQPDHRST